MIDPHVVAMSLNMVLIAVILALVLYRGIQNGRKKIWKRFSLPALPFLILSALFFASVLHCNGDTGWCVQQNVLFLSSRFDFTDISSIIYTLGISTLAFYVLTEK